jgi:hypothetical protein
MLNDLSAKCHYALRTDWKLAMNYITQYQRMTGYYPTGFCHLLAGITLSNPG